ncbi:outer membrane protein assembly factor BamB family protein [Halovenus sp. HT40]|uniref:outer membrane protein assembly factor BamB family protein n=1 Tax=Halovenus sp. HT40 TaxID=3126691 RepID=UPI00300EC238
MSSLANTVDLGSVEPARSRHAGRRSTVAVGPDTVVVGTADGTVRAFERDSLTQRWRVASASDHGDDPSVVSAAICDGTVIVGERSALGRIRGYDLVTGECRFRSETADDIGSPTKETRFFLPFVVDIETAGGRVYVAARRYERDAGERSFESVIYAVDPGGTVRWRYRTDASPISLDASEDRIAVAYNRCPGEYQHGLAILDADSGDERWHWDPGTEGQRRVGDVSLLSDGVAVASHGDYRGYRLDPSGAVRWQADLATPQQIGDETLYAYPNHVHATEHGVLFVTGNTYAEESRETDALHPDEHTVSGYAPRGTQRWEADIGGFATGVDTDGDTVAVPSAQHFRSRDPDGHGLSTFDVASGSLLTTKTDGVVTATALDGTELVAVEEPVSYHDDDRTHGRYRLHREDAV